MLTPEVEKAIQETITVVTAMFKAGQIDSDVYYKALVCTAYEFTAAGVPLRAAAIVQQIPIEYFQAVQRQQMQDDSNYALVAYELALSLVHGGLVHLGPKVSPTMPAASA